MLLGTLGASLLGNMLTGKGVLRASYGNKEEKGVLRAGYGNIYIYFSIPPHPLTNFEIKKYYETMYT